MRDPLLDALSRLAPTVDTGAALTHVHHTADLARRRQRVLLATAAVLALVLILSGAAFATSTNNSVGIDTIDDDTHHPSTTAIDRDIADEQTPTTVPNRVGEPPQSPDPFTSPGATTVVTLPFTPTGTTVAPRPGSSPILTAGPGAAVPDRRPVSTRPGPGAPSTTSTSATATTATTASTATTTTAPATTTTVAVPAPDPDRVTVRIDADNYGSALLGRPTTFTFSVKNGGPRPFYVKNTCPGSFDMSLQDPPPARSPADLWPIDLPHLHDVVAAGGTANHGWDPVRRKWWGPVTCNPEPAFFEIGRQQYYGEDFIWEALTKPGAQPDISGGALPTVGFRAVATLYSRPSTDAPSLVIDRTVTINLHDPADDAVSDGVELYPVDRAVAVVEQNAIVAGWLNDRSSCYVRIVFRVDRWEIWFEDPAGPRLRVLVDAAERVTDIRTLGAGGPSDDPELPPATDEMVLYPAF